MRRAWRVRAASRLRPARAVCAGVAGACAAVVLLAGCGGSAATGAQAAGKPSGHGPAVKIMARALPTVGTVLVTDKGYALYMFEPDNHRSVTCTGAGGLLSARHLHDAALVIHDFIEGFHEGLEEGFVFPRLRQAGPVTDTVSTLLVQHARGRVLTQFILAHATASGVASRGVRGELAAAMQAFVRMYEPHEAREDTVVFPAFRQLVSPAELAGLGQHFTDLEHQQFGQDELTAMVGRVAAVEQALGIYDLARFTPDVTAYQPPQ